MRSASLSQDLDEIEKSLPELERQRSRDDAFANDVYEAASYWVHLARRVLEGDTAVNFPARVAEETRSLSQLVGILKSRSEEEPSRYAMLFERAKELLAIVASVTPRPEGHLGFVKIVRSLFQFVELYGFEVVDWQPTALRYSSAGVHLTLEWSPAPSISCCFGPEGKPPRDFWIDDLLYINGDRRYRSIPQRLDLGSSKNIEEWFSFVADVLKQYGTGVLRNESGIFARLERAQHDRDAEYTAEMDRKYGGKG